MIAQLARRWRLIGAITALAVAAGLLMLPQDSSAALGDNLVPNPTVDRLRGRNPADWSRGAWGSIDARYSIAKPGQAGGGDSALQIRVTRYESGDAKWMFPAVAAVPGAQYDFGFSYKANVVSSVVAEITMADGTHQYQPLGDLPANRATWQEYHGSLIAPEGAAKLTVYHLIAAVGWIRNDTFTLAQVSEPGVAAPPTEAPTTLAPAGSRRADRPAATTAAPPVVPVPASPEAAPTPTPTPEAPPATTAAPPAAPAPPATPSGQKCVVGMPGAGGSTDINGGFGGGKGYPQGAGFSTRTTPNMPELADVQRAAEGCGAVVIHGFSEGARRAKELFCSGETLGGRVVGYILDDPNYFPDEGQPCTPGAGVRIALYATQMSPGDSQWTINIYLSGLGYGDVLAKTVARIGVAAKLSPNYSHIPYSNPNPPELSSWW